MASNAPRTSRRAARPNQHRRAAPIPSSASRSPDDRRRSALRRGRMTARGRRIQPLSTAGPAAASPLSSAAPSARITTPFTSMCERPTGASATSRSPSAGKSCTRRNGPGATVSASNTVMSAALPGAIVPRSEAVDGRGLAGELVDRPLHRHHLAVAHPVAEQVGREARVAELAHVRTRVGQAEQHRLLREEPRDRVGVVVGEHAREAGLEVFGERDVEHHVERRAAALLGELGERYADELGMRRRLGDRERRPVGREHPLPLSSSHARPATPDRGTRRCVPRGWCP